MMNTTRQLSLATACVIALAGCGSKKDVSKSNFASALKTSLEKNNDLCLTNPDWTWPVDVPDNQIPMEKLMRMGTSVQLDALQGVGLVNEVPSIISQKSMFGNMMQQQAVYRYTLTDKGKGYLKSVSTNTLFETNGPKKPAVCVGKSVLDEVKKWDGPMRLGDYAEATVYYSLKVTGLPDWTGDPAVQQAFPVLQQSGNGSPVDRQAVLKLTSNGWEVKGLD